ncbi:MAG: hypothetical protein LUG50_06740 [Planctomycetaceae bacterium]|nr:hypothetical protein [Planctomycetaceae bacterium]
MLSTEVYYLKNSSLRGYWWYAIIERGHLGQVIERFTKRPCANKRDAYRLARVALAKAQGNAMRLNPYVTVLISLSILLGGLILFTGCHKSPTAPPPVPPKDAVTAKEAVPVATDPFHDVARKTAAVIADTAREQPSIISTESLERLHISGLALLFVAIAARFLFGRWKDAYIATGLGVIPSVLAVLLTEYSRVVLLVPLCGLALLTLVVYRRLAEWRTKAQGFDAASTVIEKADTGPSSLGQLMKDRIAETPVAGIVDKALTYMEKLWTK